VNESRVSGQPTEDMSHNASVSKSQAAPVDLSPRQCAAQYLAETMRTGSCPNDRSFDRFLPEPLRLVSPEYWTPLAVAKRAAEWFEDLGIRTVVDIGSGAGKFCVAGALFGKCRFIGLEQYSSLVTSARALVDLFDLNHRVSFVAGTVGTVPAPVGDAYYFFNPFGEYSLGADHPLEAGAEFTDNRYADDVAAAEELLRRVPVGTCVLTYNGFGGRVPASYELVRVDWELRGALRLWRKQQDTPRLGARQTMNAQSRGQLALAWKSANSDLATGGRQIGRVVSVTSEFALRTRNAPTTARARLSSPISSCMRSRFVPRNTMNSFSRWRAETAKLDEMSDRVSFPDRLTAKGRLLRVV
jgi:predicted RNA methylase